MEPGLYNVAASGQLGQRSRPGAAPEPIMGSVEFICDTTVRADGLCVSHRLNDSVMAAQIEIMPHARDPSRVVVILFGRPFQGVLYADLLKGVKLRNTNIRIERYR
ncbi:MAG: hypothetical protein AB1744_08270 [Candidatus Zixiibacteriota bacterium]